ncbi:hypothetical protein SASPL_120292 [Salvia splendens]|uniref:Uncharacterized protein n=1 Tax=Salvia splendens TaxID=180675 RepID=A0A8X8ZV47_SALSN|nr:hypothetical protein SASPL_120292 [Salvia splendens]
MLPFSIYAIHLSPTIICDSSLSIIFDSSLSRHHLRFNSNPVPSLRFLSLPPPFSVHLYTSCTPSSIAHLFKSLVAKLTGVDVLKVDAEKGKITVATAIRKAGYSDERWTTKETRSQT